jgi:predicted glutamine amidotransferase
VRDRESPETNAAQQVILLASVPLTQESWAPMPEGEVVALRRGEIVASVQL